MTETDQYGWPLCACGKQSIASLVDHSCIDCFDDYAKCPRCNDKLGLLCLEANPIEGSLADNLEEDGPWMT